MDIKQINEELDRVLNKHADSKPFVKDNLPHEAFEAYKELADSPIFTEFQYYPRTSHEGAIRYVCIDKKDEFCKALKRKIAKAFEFDDLKVVDVEVYTDYLFKSPHNVEIVVNYNNNISIDTIIRIITDAYGDLTITKDEYDDYIVENDNYENQISYIFGNYNNDLGNALWDKYLQECAYEAFEEVRYSKEELD